MQFSPSRSLLIYNILNYHEFKQLINEINVDYLINQEKSIDKSVVQKYAKGDANLEQ